MWTHCCCTTFSRTAQLSLSSLARPFFCFVVDFFCIFGTFVIHYYTAFKFLKYLKFVSSLSSWNGRYGFHIPLSLQNWGNISFFFWRWKNDLNFLLSKMERWFSHIFSISLSYLASSQWLIMVLSLQRSFIVLVDDTFFPQPLLSNFFSNCDASICPWLVLRCNHFDIAQHFSFIFFLMIEGLKNI